MTDDAPKDEKCAVFPSSLGGPPGPNAGDLGDDQIQECTVRARTRRPGAHAPAVGVWTHADPRGRELPNGVFGRVDGAPLRPGAAPGPKRRAGLRRGQAERHGRRPVPAR